MQHTVHTLYGHKIPKDEIWGIEESNVTLNLEKTKIALFLGCSSEDRVGNLLFGFLNESLFSCEQKSDREQFAQVALKKRANE